MDLSFVSICLLLKNKKILVTQRPKNKPHSYFWEFPGGKLENNENFYDAAIRELKEELNIEVSKEKLILIDNVNYSYKKNRIIIMSVFLLRNWQNELAPNEKQKMIWVKENKIEKMNFLKGGKVILNRIRKNLYNFYL